MADFNQMSAAFQQGGAQQNIQYVDQLGVLCQQKFKEFLTQFSDLSYASSGADDDAETQGTFDFFSFSYDIFQISH